MIVTLNFPSNITRVQYGIAGLMPDADHTMAVPAYMAKTLLSLDGVIGPTPTGSALSLLSGTESGSEFEANYIFIAYNQPIPPVDDRIAAAIALMTARGEPSASMT